MAAHAEEPRAGQKRSDKKRLLPLSSMLHPPRAHREFPSPRPWSRSVRSARGTPVDLDFGVLVKSALGAALRVEADIPGFNAFGIDQFPFVRLKILAISPHTKTRLVLLVVVEDGFDILNEILIVGDLHNYRM